MSEHQLQTGIFAYLRRALPDDAFVSSVDHARKQSQLSGLFQRARGVRAGLPDLVIVHRGRAYWMEVKTDAGSLSDAQRALHVEIRRAGAEVAVVRSIEDAEGWCRTWGVPLRATTLTPTVRAALSGEARPKRPSTGERGDKPTLARIRRAEAVRARTRF